MDATLSPGLISRWQKWEMDLPSGEATSCSLACVQEPLQSIELHAFGDASGKGVAAVVYAVITQSTKTYQGLVTAKARLAKQGLTTLERDRLQLNQQRNAHGLLECRGRNQGFYPIYIPDFSTLAERFVEYAHNATLHGGVGLTMTKVLERHWIPRLRRLVVKKCHGCKRYQAIAYATPPPGALLVRKELPFSKYTCKNAQLVFA